MNKFFKSISCLLTMFVVSTSGFCSGSNSFGIGLLLGTSKSKISNINNIKEEYGGKKDFTNGVISGIIQGLAMHGITISESDIKNRLDITSKDNPFFEKSDFSFDIGLILFDQYNFNNTFFARVGAFCNVPVAKNKFSFFNENLSIKTKNSENWKATCNMDLKLKHSLDVVGQLCMGFNITKIFSFIIGGELGYTVGKLSFNVGGTVNNELIKEGYNDNDTVSFGSLFGGGICGIEFNFNNVVIGVHGFLHSIKLNNSSFKIKDNKDKTIKTNKDNSDILKLINTGVRLMIAYKF